jgi:hypothetical protein
LERFPSERFNKLTLADFFVDRSIFRAAERQLGIIAPAPFPATTLLMTPCSGALASAANSMSQRDYGN